MWQIEKLGDAIKLEYGKPLPDSKRKYNGKYPVYGANGEKDRTDEYYCSKRSIIVGRKGSAGEVNLTEERFWPLDVTYYVDFDNNQYDLIFLYHLLKRLRLSQFVRGVKPGINRNDVYSISVAVPPLFEQKRIVAKIESLFSRLDSAKVSLLRVHAEIKRYRQSVLKSAFEGKLTETQCEYKNTTINGLKATLCGDWFVCRMGNFVKLQGGFAFKSKEFVLDGIPIVKIANVNVDNIDWTDRTCIARNRLSEFKSFQLKVGDILVAMTRPVIKSLNTVKVVVVRENDLPALLNQRVGRFVLDGRVNNNYLRHYISTDFFKKRVVFESSSSQQPNISSNSIENFDFILPKNMDTQIEIVKAIESRFERAKVLEETVEQGLEKIEQLKQSILKEAFEGKLVEPDPNDEPVEVLLERIKNEKLSLVGRKEDESSV
ncbi:MAG: restriction endonuclease subunit S [Candidatus Omnitrophota bacterium]|jgi:type I restriction enzyme S subunit